MGVSAPVGSADLLLLGLDGVHQQLRGWTSSSCRIVPASLVM